MQWGIVGALGPTFNAKVIQFAFMPRQLSPSLSQKAMISVNQQLGLSTCLDAAVAQGLGSRLFTPALNEPELECPSLLSDHL